ncbi:tetratricopeptide repeat protein [Streptomyces sp. B6B3]|uniref:AfsR/SARP family transcriptional regulator n=1 Tax=Streptomyces sp. B6B3 TaxID=3153570 RepID=UPI00325F8915
MLNTGHLRQQCVLAALLVDANSVVSIDQLVDRVWGERPPARATATLYTYIYRLRAALADADDVSLEREHGGYALGVDPASVDLHRFRDLLARAAAGAGDVARLLEDALRLWRSAPFGSLDTDWINSVRDTLVADRLTAELDLFDLYLPRGEHARLLPTLTARTAEHPLDERLAAQVIRGLHAAGRQGDALLHYERVRRSLSRELGVDPGPHLRRLHQQILTADPALDATPPAALHVVPTQLPADTAAFTGRDRELDELLALCSDRSDRPDRSHQEPGAVVVSVIDGMAGVGKTTLAVRAALRLAPAFPDGQVFLDLHGHTEGREPMDPAAALEVLLRALGVPNERIPPGLDERAALYRTRLTGTRVLILLDNASGERQVLPLLPAAPGCLVMVTSRRHLLGIDDARHLSLDVLSREDATALFTRAAGAPRLAAEPAERVVEVVELCGRLPLALRIAAARLRSRPVWSLTHLVQRLTDQQDRLTELQAGQRSVTAALELSYRHLTSDQRHTYRLLSLHPGTDIDRDAAAALTGLPVARAARLLDDLVDAHLLAEPLPGRYRSHDLIRAHATATALAEDTEPERRGALAGLLAHYAHATSVAMDAVYPHETGQRPAVPPVVPSAPDIASPLRAEAWLDAELDNLLAAAHHAASHGQPEHALHQSAALHRHLRVRGRYGEAVVLHDHARRVAGDSRDELAALNRLGDVHYMRDRNEKAVDCFERALDLARTTGDRDGEQNALTGLGHIHRHLGRYERAADCFERALDLARTTGNRAGEGYALYGLGHVRGKSGGYQGAADCFERALRLARATGDRDGEQSVLAAYGHVHGHLGRYERAADCFERALNLARTTGNRGGQGYALYGLGHVRGMLGDHERAADCFELALRLARASGNHHGEMYARHGLGDVHRMLGQYPRAAEHYRQLLETARASGDRNGQFEGHEGLGRCHHALGDHADALACHRDALAIAADLGQLDDECRAHDGLAHAYHALGRHADARRHWRTALALLARHGSDHTWDPRVTADSLRARLDRVDWEEEG